MNYSQYKSKHGKRPMSGSKNWGKCEDKIKEYGLKLFKI